MDVTGPRAAQRQPRVEPGATESTRAPSPPPAGRDPAPLDLPPVRAPTELRPPPPLDWRRLVTQGQLSLEFTRPRPRGGEYTTVISLKRYQPGMPFVEVRGLTSEPVLRSFEELDKHFVVDPVTHRLRIAGTDWLGPSLSQAGELGAVERPNAVACRLTTAFSWHQFFDEVGRTMRQNLRRESEHYARELARGERHLVTLGLLGVDVTKPEALPPMTSIVRRYRLHMAGLVQRGEIRAEDVLDPGLVFRRDDGSFVAVPLGAPLPEGVGAPYEGVLPQEVFTQAIAAGIFPFGGSEDSSRATTGLSVFEHDLAHLTGFIERPEFMAAFRRVFGSAEPTQSFGAIWRRYFAAEAMVIVPEPQRLAALLRLPQKPLGIDDDYTLDELERHLAALSAEEQEHLAATLDREFVSLVLPLGGAARDTFNGRQNSEHDLLYSHLSSLRRARQVRRQELPQALAGLQLCLLECSRISALEWLEEAVRVSPPRSSKLRRLFAEKGLASGRPRDVYGE